MNCFFANRSGPLNKTGRRKPYALSLSVSVLIILCSTGTALFAAIAPSDDVGPRIRVTLPPYILTYMDPKELLKRPNPLLTYLERETGAQVELSMPASYAAAVEGMAKGQLDIVELGGLEYVQASARGVVRPLVQRDIDRQWHTVFLTQPGSGINSLRDLNGHTFAFGSLTSVSSRVMPEYWLRDAKVDMKVIQDALARSEHQPTERHDMMHFQVALAVVHKEVDAGAMDRAYYDAMLKDGRITPQQVRIFWESPTYSDPIWVVRKDFDPILTQKVANAFMKLDVKKADEKAVLDLFHATKYIPASDSAYDILRKAINVDGLMK